jgi:hypothetical protein
VTQGFTYSQMRIGEEGETLTAYLTGVTLPAQNYDVSYRIRLIGRGNHHYHLRYFKCRWPIEGPEMIQGGIDGRMQNIRRDLLKDRILPSTLDADARFGLSWTWIAPDETPGAIISYPPPPAGPPAN